MSNNKLYIVHAVDTEGFLYQSTKATILRVNSEFGTNFIESKKIIEQLRNKEIDVNGKEDEISNYLSTVNFISNHIDYKKHINAVTCPEFRKKYTDPRGGCYKWSWYILDNVATHINPRRRLYGYGQIFYLLQESVNSKKYLEPDGIYLHYHQMKKDQHSFEKETLFCSSDEYNQILCRSIIERRDFPESYRAGYCLERYDANLWLENWIPYDFSNEAPTFNVDAIEQLEKEMDYWLRAPSDWSHYHPDSHDYQIDGNLRRTIFRSLCYKTMDYGITENDVKCAFERVDSGKDTVLSIYSHDFRPLLPEAAGFYNLITKVSKLFPNVDWEFSTAVEAARSVLGYKEDIPLKLKLWIEGSIVYASSNKSVFGSEPYLAIQTVDDRFVHHAFVKIKDNLWGVKVKNIDLVWRIGIGANDRAGFSDTRVLEKVNGQFVMLKNTGYWSGSPE